MAVIHVGEPESVDAGLNRASMQCLLCGGVEHRSIFTEFGIDILRCRKCLHVFSSYAADPHYTGFWGDQIAADGQFYWSKARARMHGDFFERFVAGRSGRLLDMGSGLGFFLKAMARYAEWEAYGCEISPVAVGYAHGELGLRNVLCSKLENVDLQKASFDIITMWDVLDHILRPDPVLSHCHALLKKDGALFIRTPNISVQLLRARLKKALRGVRTGSKYLQGSDHLHNYSMRSIRRLLERNGFVDVEFVHLHPIESEPGRLEALVRPVKNLCFQTLRALAFMSGGRLNYDNLFVVARKRAMSPQVIR